MIFCGRTVLFIQLTHFGHTLEHMSYYLSLSRGYFWWLISHLSDWLGFLGGLNLHKPPNSITSENFLSAIWDTSLWNFFVKFGLKTA